MNQEQEQYQPRAESKAPDSVRIAEPAVATSEANQESSKTADDMIERVSVRSVANDARPEVEDMISRATPSPADFGIPSDYASDGSQRPGRPRSYSHDSVDSVRIAESDSDEAPHFPVAILGRRTQRLRTLSGSIRWHSSTRDARRPPAKEATSGEKKVAFSACGS